MSDPELAHLERTRAEKMARAVLPASALAWTATEVMRLAGVHAALPAGGATALAAALAWGAAGRRDDVPDSLPWWVAVAGGWLTAASALGPLAGWPAPVLTVAGAAIALAARRAAFRHEAVTSARDWRATRAGWLEKRGRWGLPRTHLLDYRETHLGERYLISTKGSGKLASQFPGRSIAELIAEDLDLPVSRVEVKTHRLAGRLEVGVRFTDPWARPLLHPLACAETGIELPASRSILDEALVGQDPETGAALGLPLCDEAGGKNIAVTGIKGAGKGVLLDDISEHVTAVPDALMIRLNLSAKGYAEAASWGPACHLTAFGPDQAARAVAVLKVVAGVIEWRARNYKRGQYKPRPGDPAVVVIVDESDSAASAPGVKAGLDDVATKGREYGVAFVHAGQRGTANYTSAKARSQDDVSCTGMVSRQGEMRHSVGGMGARDMSTYGEGRPGVWNIARLGGGACAGRAWVLDADPARHAEAVERIAEERARVQPELPAACREYLGEAYEGLLADEVFARWARAQEDDGAPDGPGLVRVDGPALAQAARDARSQAPRPGAVALEAERPAAPAAAEDPLRGLDWEAKMNDRERELLARLDAKNAGTRQVLEETAAMPKPEMSQEDREAAAAGAWQRLGEETKVPGDVVALLLEMLEKGTTISAAAAEFKVSKWTARKWLENLRGRGLVKLDGDGRGARWLAVKRPESAA